MASTAVAGVRRIAKTADLDNIDAWWAKVAEDIIALVAAGWAVTRELAEIFLGEHAAIEGRQVTAVPAEWDTEQVATALRVTGPVAFKQHITNGGTAVSARAAMGNRLAGSVERLVLAGERDTVDATVEESHEIVGYRRVSDGDPCAFCAMLVSRGAVYKDARSAGDARFGGTPYHDRDGCTAVPLYEHEDEPAEVADLYQQWLDATAGKSGDDAVRAWRRYWDDRGERPVEEVAPEPAPQRAEPDTQPANDLASIVGAITPDAPRTKLGGGLSAVTELVDLPDGRRVVHKRGMDWGEPEEVAESIRQQADAEELASVLGRAIDAPVAEVLRDGVDAVWMEFIADTEDADGNDLFDLFGTPEGIRLGLLDILSGNSDRNQGNLLVKDGKLVGIDHGWAWAEGGIDEHVQKVVSAPDRPISAFLAYLDVYGPNPLHPDDIDVLAARLSALRETFERRGRDNWLDYSLAILEQMRPYATGTERLYG